MSYDTSIIIDTGGRYPAEVEEIGNYTGNVGAMYRILFPSSYENGGKYNGVGESSLRNGLPGLSGLNCTVASLILREGIIQMQDRINELKRFEPSNGWGSYDGALIYLQSINAACLRHPKGTLAVNW